MFSGWLHKFQGPVQNENVDSLVQKLLRSSRQPSGTTTGPLQACCMTMKAALFVFFKLITWFANKSLN